MKRLFCGMGVLAILLREVGPTKADYLYTTLDVPGAAATQALLRRHESRSGFRA